MNFLYFKTVFNHLKRQRVKSQSIGCSFPPGNSLWTFLLPPVLLFLSLQRTSASLSLSLSLFFCPPPPSFPSPGFCPTGSSILHSSVPRPFIMQGNMLNILGYVSILSFIFYPQLFSLGLLNRFFHGEKF